MRLKCRNQGVICVLCCRLWPGSYRTEVEAAGGAARFPIPLLVASVPLLLSMSNETKNAEVHSGEDHARREEALNMCLADPLSQNVLCVAPHGALG